jgi:predicted nucleotidyltransferase
MDRTTYDTHRDSLIVAAREGEKLPLESLLPRLAKIFATHRVVVAYLFGSQAEGTAGPLSDVDIAVLFDRAVPQDDHFDLHLSLIGALTSLFHRDDVDVADLDRASPLLKQQVRLRGQIVYCADEAERLHFELKALQEYEDTRPLREFRYRHLIRSIREGSFGRAPLHGRMLNVRITKFTGAPG